MKNYLVILIAFLCVRTYSQSSILLTYKQLKVDTIYVPISQTTISPGAIIQAPTWDNSLTTIVIDIKNTGTITHTYEVQRYDVGLNQPSDTARAYFCFALYCYPDSVFVSPDKLALASNTSASDFSASHMLSADLDEAHVKGYSIVKYTFRNVADANDSIQFSIKYNDPAFVGITQMNKILSNSMEVYPNPTHDKAILKVNSVKNFEGKLTLYNALGSAVYSENVSVAEGKNQIPLNVENLTPGIYIANIKQGGETIAKKLIVD
jgi:hypothetical protein